MTDRDSQADAIERLGRALVSSVDFEFDAIVFSCDLSEPDVQTIKVSASKRGETLEVDLDDEVYEALDELEEALRESQEETPKMVSGSVTSGGNIEIDMKY